MAKDGMRPWAAAGATWGVDGAGRPALARRPA
jgi:hypothetical protein